MKTKICSKCGIEKELSKFGKHKNNKDGLTYHCKDCLKKYSDSHKEERKIYTVQNKEKIKEYLKEYNKKHSKDYRELHKEKIKEYQQSHKKEFSIRTKNYYQLNKKELKEYQYEYTQSHKIERLAYQKEYRASHKEKINNRANERRKTDINYKILGNLRSRITVVLKKNSKSKSTMKLLGCSIEKLKQHLEKQFTKGMAWNNYGKWHVDHIIPCASFNFLKASEQQKCFHYTNLRPLWAKDNLRRKRYIK